MSIKRCKHQYGFSLIELLIVIIIISIVYFLGFSNIEKQLNTTKALTPLNLKQTIINSDLFQGSGIFICIDKCKSCYIRKDINSPFQEYKNKINLKNIEVYILDSHDTLQEVEYGRYKDIKICLMVQFYQNKSSSQIILKQDEDVYFLPAFFDKAQKVDSLNDAKELWLKNNSLVSNLGDFY